LWQHVRGLVAVGDLDHAGVVQRRRQTAEDVGELARHGLEIGGAMVPVLAFEQRLRVQQAQHLHLVERAVALVVGKAVGAKVEAVPDRDLVPPPKLARDAPGLDVLQPVEIDLAVAGPA
jgi:hypothetical protein